MDLIDQLKARYAPTRARLRAVFLIWGAIAAATAAAMYALALTGASDIMIGGDFAVFHVAANGVLDGAAVENYDFARFYERLKAAFPERDDLGLSWQYPPTYYFLITPFAGLPHLAAFALWSSATATAFFLTLRGRIEEPLILFGAAVSPAAYVAYITGQNGFLTAMLLLFAAYDPKARPVLAGLAAGLLTVKPHLGLLIPVAYLAVGAWRAGAIAALTGGALAAASVLVFGIAAWAGFFDAVFGVTGRVADAVMPLGKMASPYAAALHLGLPNAAAWAFYGAVALFAGLAVWRVWRRIADPALRAAVLIAATMPAAPFGFHYELVMLAYPVALCALRGLREGWLAGERTMIALAWILPGATLSLAGPSPGIALAFGTAIVVFVLMARRAHAGAPDLLPWPAPKSGRAGVGFTADRTASAA